MRIADHIPAIHSLCVFEQSQDKDRVFHHPHGRGHHALSLRLTGKSRFEAGKESVISADGSVTFAAARTPYTQSVCEGSKIIVLHFESHAAIPSVLLCELPTDKAQRAEITRLFLEMLDLFQTGSLASISRLYADFYALLALLLAIDPQNSSEELARRVDEILLGHLSDPQFSISDMARELSVSESFLRRFFLASYGCSPRKQLIRMRVKRACAMLSGGCHGVAEIASLCGFSSPSYFSRVFKEETKQTPTEFMSSLPL